MHSYKVTPLLLKKCIRYQDEFQLSYSQLSKWLYKYHDIKITPMGIRKAILRELSKQ